MHTLFIFIFINLQFSIEDMHGMYLSQSQLIFNIKEREQTCCIPWGGNLAKMNHA